MSLCCLQGLKVEELLTGVGFVFGISLVSEIMRKEVSGFTKSNSDAAQQRWL